jgi:glucose uptake protein GlcU
VLGVAVVAMIVIAIGEQIFLTSSARKQSMESDETHNHQH